MSTFSRLVSVVRYLVLAVGGSVTHAFGGSSAPVGLAQAIEDRGPSMEWRAMVGRGFRLALPVVVVSVLFLGAGSASAAITHKLLFSFDGSGTPAGSFTPR